MGKKKQPKRKGQCTIRIDLDALYTAKQRSLVIPKQWKDVGIQDVHTALRKANLKYGRVFGWVRVHPETHKEIKA